MIPIVTINYNGSKDTIELIDSLLKSRESFSLIVVDNDSPNKSEEDTIKKHLVSIGNKEPININYVNELIKNVWSIEICNNNFYFIQANSNYGFSKGTNVGINFCLNYLNAFKYIAILNNDTVVTDFFLSKVVDKMEKYGLAAAMGTILYYGYNKPYIWSIGGPISWLKAQAIHLKKGEIFVQTNDDVVLREFVSGCFTVFETEKIVEIGLLDEDYFFAGEEYQYSYDLAKKYKIGWIPDSIIYHKSVLDIGNGSSHNIQKLYWQYNSYMVKVVFVNKNKNWFFRLFWHSLLRLYFIFVLRHKYLKNPAYGRDAYYLLKKHVFSNINSKKFTYKDFSNFVELCK